MKKIMKKIIKRMNLRISLLSLNFAMIYIVYKIIVLIKNDLNYLKISIFEFVFKKCNRLSFF